MGISKFVEAQNEAFQVGLETPMGLICEGQVLSATDETQTKSEVSSENGYVHLLMNNHIL